MNPDDLLCVTVDLTPAGELRVKTMINPRNGGIIIANAVDISEAVHTSLSRGLVTLMDEGLQAMADTVDPEDRAAYDEARASVNRMMALVLPNPLDKLN